MIERVLLVAWKGSAATAWVDTLKTGGYTVLLEDTTGERAWRTAKERGIDCVIIDGQKKPSHGRQTGNALRDTAKTRNIPIIWTNLDSEDAQGVLAEVKPDVTVAAPCDAAGALVALQNLAAERRDQPSALGTAPGELPVTPEPKAAAPAERKAPTKKKPAAKAAPKKPAKKPAAKKAPAKAKSAKKPARAAKTAKK